MVSFEARVQRFEHGRFGEFCGNKDDRRICIRGFNGFAHGVEHRNAQYVLTALARRYARDDVRAVSEHLLGMEGALAAGNALNDEPRVLIDNDAHRRSLLSSSAAMDSRNPSVRTTSECRLSMISTPLSLFVPSMRTTISFPSSE